MGPDGETLLHPFPTSTTLLTGISGRHRDHATASVCCFAFENGPKLPPARVTYALRQVTVLD